MSSKMKLTLKERQKVIKIMIKRDSSYHRQVVLMKFKIKNRIISLTDKEIASVLS